MTWQTEEQSLSQLWRLEDQDEGLDSTRISEGKFVSGLSPGSCCQGLASSGWSLHHLSFCLHLPVAFSLMCVCIFSSFKTNSHLSSRVRALPGDKLSSGRNGAQRAAKQSQLLGAADGGRKDPNPAALLLLCPVCHILCFLNINYVCVLCRILYKSSLWFFYYQPLSLRRKS